MPRTYTSASEHIQDSERPGDPFYNPHNMYIVPRFGGGGTVRVRDGYQSAHQEGRYKPGVRDGDVLTVKEYGLWGTTVTYYGFEEIGFVISEEWLVPALEASEPKGDNS